MLEDDQYVFTQFEDNEQPILSSQGIPIAGFTLPSQNMFKSPNNDKNYDNEIFDLFANNEEEPVTEEEMSEEERDIHEGDDVIQDVTLACVIEKDALQDNPLYGQSEGTWQLFLEGGACEKRYQYVIHLMLCYISDNISKYKKKTNFEMVPYFFSDMWKKKVYLYYIIFVIKLYRNG